MITKRLVRVQAVLLAGFGSIFLLPHSNKISPAGIAMTLPNVVGAWIGEDAAVTQKELDVLAKDTKFARKIYTGPERDQIRPAGPGARQTRRHRPVPGRHRAHWHPPAPQRPPRLYIRKTGKLSLLS